MKKILLISGICLLIMAMISCDKTSNEIHSDNSGVYIDDLVYDNIQDAIDAAATGDTLVLTQGIYAGTNNTNLMWDGGDKHLVITTDQRGFQADYAIIEGNGKGAGFYFDNTQQNENDIISGITIRNMGTKAEEYNAAFYCNGAAPLVQNCFVYDCPWSAVYCFNANPRFENSTFFDNYATFNLDGESDPVILLCYIENSSLDAVYAKDDSYPALFNNLIANNQRGIYLHSANALMVSNTIVSNTEWGVKVNSDLVSQMINCILWDNNGNDFVVTGDSLLNASYTCAPTEYPNINPSEHENIYDNPDFLSSNDYHLKSTSPCRDIGNPGVVYWDSDLDGEPRIHNNEIDLGAYEWHP
ncbi:MAG: right-handed parallel beta-helix repeat-containing protein [Candidatus Cloacimonetes bacterium]|nr:right-handed parallel beta-helix repeat-containing protein [Candidatus Cloacimonadota bacterium]